MSSSFLKANALSIIRILIMFNLGTAIATFVCEINNNNSIKGDINCLE